MAGAHIERVGQQSGSGRAGETQRGRGGRKRKREREIERERGRETSLPPAQSENARLTQQGKTCREVKSALVVHSKPSMEPNVFR